MYLWVIIATFITILYSYNISVRTDLDRVHAETKASVMVTKFRAQHYAVKDYFSSQERAKIGHTSVSYHPGDGYNLPEDATEQKIDDSKIEGYLPVGFSIDEDTITRVICLEEDKPNAVQCTSGVDGSCCTDDGVAIYVVSYREIPSRWINKSNGKPNADILGSMGKTYSYGKIFGYTETVDGKLMLSGGYMVQDYDQEGNAQGEPHFEQKEIFHVIQNYPEFEKCKSENVHCLYALQRIYG